MYYSNAPVKMTGIIDASDSAVSLSNVIIGKLVYSTINFTASAIGLGNSQQFFTIQKMYAPNGVSKSNIKQNYSFTVKGIAITNAEYSSWDAIPNDYKVTF